METNKIILIVLLIILVIVLVCMYLIPHYRKRSKKSKVTVEYMDVDEKELNDLYIGIIPDAGIRKKMNAYNEVFLTDRLYKGKNQIYISKDIYDRIKRIVPLVAPDLTCSTFVSNILVQHLDEYQMVLRAISEINFKTTLSSWKTSSDSISEQQ